MMLDQEDMRSQKTSEISPARRGDSAEAATRRFHEISAVIITRNEELNIGRCIDSIQGVVDEIVVVDAFSTDRTEEICRQRNTVFLQREWEGFARAKNWANQQASHDYILSLDADEALSPELRSSLLAAKQAGLEGAAEFKRLTNYCGTWVRHGGWYPDKKIRLFPKDGARWVGNYVHETLQLDGKPKVRLLAGDLWHYSYISIEQHRERIERYSDLHARQLLEDGRRADRLTLLLAPACKFFQIYVLKLGFLDGPAGYMIARYSARAVRLKYEKLRRLRS